MAHGSIVAVGALGTRAGDALIGITDLAVAQTAGGTVLYSAGRAGGWVTGFDAGTAAGDTRVRLEWQIPEQFLQLETTDMVFRSGSDTGEVLLAGLNSDDMLAVQLSGAGTSFAGTRTYESAGRDLGDLSGITALGEGGDAFGALRAGGLVHAQFLDTGQARVTQVNLPAELGSARVSALDSMVFAGASHALAAFGTQNTFALFSGTQGGALSLRGSVTADERLSFNQLSDAVLTQVDGVMYAVVAASGTGSLGVFSVNTDTSAMTAVDYVLDTRDTRFANASFIKDITYQGETYLVAAGSDQGLTLMTMLPGGTLRVLNSFEATADLPLNNITDIELAVTGDTLRIWASTMAAPYLSEFSVDLSSQGTRVVADARGETLSGAQNSDTLWGGDGADALQGGAGDDLLRDGAGEDVLSGGVGVDTFAFEADAARDTITDFERGVDRIDLGPVDLADVQVTVRSWGSELRYGEETIRVYSADGDPLRAEDFLTAFVTELSSVSLEAPPPSGPQVPPNTSSATTGNDLIYGTAENDVLDAMRGDDRVSGRGGDDAIFGRVGDDTLVGGDGADSLQGGDGNDVIYGDSDTSLDWS